MIHKVPFYFILKSSIKLSLTILLSFLHAGRIEKTQYQTTVLIDVLDFCLIISPPMVGYGSRLVKFEIRQELDEIRLERKYEGLIMTDESNLGAQNC